MKNYLRRIDWLVITNEDWLELCKYFPVTDRVPRYVVSLFGLFLVILVSVVVVGSIKNKRKIPILLNLRDHQENVI